MAKKKSTNTAPQNVTTQNIVDAKKNYLTTYSSENVYNNLAQQQMDQNAQYLQENLMYRRGGQPCYECGGHTYNNGGAYLDAYNQTNNPAAAFGFLGQMGRNARTWFGDQDQWVTKLKPSRKFKKQNMMNDFYMNPANYGYFDPGGESMSKRILEGSNLTRPIPGVPQGSTGTQSTLDQIKEDFTRGSDFWEKGYVNPYLNMAYNPFGQGWGRGDYEDINYPYRYSDPRFYEGADIDYYPRNTGIRYPGYPPMMPQRRGYGRGWMPSAPPGMGSFLVPTDTGYGGLKTLKVGPRRAVARWASPGTAATPGSNINTANVVEGAKDLARQTGDAFRDLGDAAREKINKRQAKRAVNKRLKDAEKYGLTNDPMPPISGNRPAGIQSPGPAPEGYIQREVDSSVPANAYPQTSSADFGSGIGGVEQGAPALTKAEQRAQKKADKAQAKLEKKKMKNASVFGKNAMVRRPFTTDMMNEMETPDNAIYTYNGLPINSSNEVVGMDAPDATVTYNRNLLQSNPSTLPPTPIPNEMDPSIAPVPPMPSPDLINAVRSGFQMGHGGVPFHEGYPQAQPFPTPWPQAMMKQGGGLWGNQQPMIYPGGMQRPAGVMPNVLGSAYYQGGGEGGEEWDGTGPAPTISPLEAWQGYYEGPPEAKPIQPGFPTTGPGFEGKQKWKNLAKQLSGIDKAETMITTADLASNMAGQIKGQKNLQKGMDLQRFGQDPITTEQAASKGTWTINRGDMKPNQEVPVQFTEGPGGFIGSPMESVRYGGQSQYKGGGDYYYQEGGPNWLTQFGRGFMDSFSSPTSQTAQPSGRDSATGPAGVGTMDEIMMMPDNAPGPGGYGTMGEYKMLLQTNPNEANRWMEWAMTKEGGAGQNFELTNPDMGYQAPAESTSVANNFRPLVGNKKGGQTYEVGGTYEMSDRELQNFIASGGQVRYF